MTSEPKTVQQMHVLQSVMRGLCECAARFNMLPQSNMGFPIGGYVPFWASRVFWIAVCYPTKNPPKTPVLREQKRECKT